MATLREKSLIKNTLGCLLKAVEGKVTTVDLRNDNEARGKIEHVDAYMNLTMSDVCLTAWHGQKLSFTQFFVHGANIRYVHIPDEIDMLKAIEEQVSVDKTPLEKRLEHSKQVQKRMERKEKDFQRAEKLRKLKEEQEKSSKEGLDSDSKGK